jgi:signal transduction histidine kinase
MQLLDSEGRFVVHPDEELVGRPFSSDGQAELGALVQGVMAGASEAKSAVYDVDGDEFLAVASPVMAVEGRPVYFVLLHVPVAVFYQEINEVLTSQRIQSFSILAGTSVSIIILAVFVNRTVSLDREVRKRTKELEESSATILQQKKELEQANEELKRLDAAKDEFLDVAAHEIRTPITPIMLAAEELEAQLGSRKDVKMILRNARKLQQLVQNVLDVARLENKTFKLNLEKADLGEVVMAVVDDFKVQVEDRPAVQFVYKPVYIDVLVDRHRIAQVLSNIMSNAVKFTKQGDITVSISAVAGGSMAQVTVADSGPGIDQEILPHLFQKFATRSEGGTGLGLYISKSIVEAHGGKIWAERREKGAAFSFTLPLYK